MNRISKFLLGGAALLVIAPLVWADCCSAPIVSANSEKELAALREKYNELLKKFEALGGGGLSGGDMMMPPMIDTMIPDAVPPTGGDGTVVPGVNPNELTQLIEGGTASGFTKEPRQQAVIAWNGREEIMVLQTFQESMVGKGAFLQFLPLPGKPIDVREGEKELFGKMATLMLSKSKVPGAEIGGVANVVFEKAVGPHHIFVWKVDNYNNFLGGVHAHIRKIYKGKAMPLITKKMEKVLRDYFERGFRYFAFDLVQITPSSTKIEALEYHFESNHLFYPVGITAGSATGNTRIELAVITSPEGVNRFFGKLRYKEEIVTWGKTVKLNAGELQAMGKGGTRIAKLFDNGEMAGRMWVLRGNIASLHGDVQADLTRSK